MKILWVKPGKLFPLDSGGKLRSYNLLRQLCQREQVTYLSYYGGQRDLEYESQIAGQFPSAVPVWARDSGAVGVRRSFGYLRSLAGSVPYAVSNFSSSQVRHVLKRWMSQRRFDVAICDFLASTPNFPQELGIPSVLFQHNVESLLWQRRVQFAANWISRTVARLEYAKMLQYERKQLRRFHRVLAVSELDRQAMGSAIDLSRIAVIPTGIDLTMYQYDPELRPAGSLVMFTGSMDWEPNIDGVEYFCSEIWPEVLRRVPGARFRIVGRVPHSRVRKLASSSIEVTGTVSSMIEQFREATVLVVPLRAGGGTRIKIYEGMAMGKATVSTSIGAEGLQVHPGRDILLADDPRQFADCVVAVLGDEDVRRRYEAAAAAAVKNFDWSVITDGFIRELQKTIDEVRQEPGQFLCQASPFS